MRAYLLPILRSLLTLVVVTIPITEITTPSVVIFVLSFGVAPAGPRTFAVVVTLVLVLIPVSLGLCRRLLSHLRKESLYLWSMCLRRRLLLTVISLGKSCQRILQIEPWHNRRRLLHLRLGCRLPLAPRELSENFLNLCLRSLRNRLLLRMGLRRLLLASIQCVQKRHYVHWRSGLLWRVLLRSLIRVILSFSRL